MYADALHDTPYAVPFAAGGGGSAAVGGGGGVDCCDRFAALPRFVDACGRPIVTFGTYGADCAGDDADGGCEFFRRCFAAFPDLPVAVAVAVAAVGAAAVGVLTSEIQRVHTLTRRCEN